MSWERTAGNRMRGDAKMRREAWRRRMEATISISFGFFYSLAGYLRSVFLQIQLYRTQKGIRDFEKCSMRREREEAR